jgi:hypothetical protein
LEGTSNSSLSSVDVSVVSLTSNGPTPYQTTTDGRKPIRISSVKTYGREHGGGSAIPCANHLTTSKGRLLSGAHIGRRQLGDPGKSEEP